MIAVILFFVAFGISLALSWWLCRPDTPLAVLDYPGERSLHERPMPRTGGLAILAGICAGFAAVLATGSGPAGHLYAMLFAVAFLGAFSFWDDLRGLPALPRLVMHFLAGGLLLLGGLALSHLAVPGIGNVPLGWLGAPLTVIFTVWFINLYNFMDGMDGFAGGLGVIGFAFLAAAGWMGGHQPLVWFALAVSGANLGFLIFNYPPARIFMGDVGAIPMGLLAAACSLWGAREGIFPLWVPILIFSPFLVDATVTLMRRVLHGEKFWQPHRSHYYQRAVLLGWGHRNTVVVEYVLMLGAGVSAIALNGLADDRPVIAGILGWGALYAALAIAIATLEARSGKRP